MYVYDMYVCMYIYVCVCVCNCGKVKGVKVFLDFSFFPVGSSTNSCDVIVMA